MRLAGVHRWWTGLARRERAMVLLAVGVVLTGVLYALAIEPAWKTRVRLPQQLPHLQADLIQLESLRAEAKRLSGRGSVVESAGSLQTAATQSIARANIMATVQLVDATSMSVRAEGVPARAWFAWLDAFTRESRAVIATASVQRTARTGSINASVSFSVGASRP